MTDESELWEQPELCSADCDSTSYTVKSRLSCWEHCCKAYCGTCAFFKDVNENSN